MGWERAGAEREVGGVLSRDDGRGLVGGGVADGFRSGRMAFVLGASQQERKERDQSGRLRAKGVGEAVADPEHGFGTIAWGAAGRMGLGRMQAKTRRKRDARREEIEPRMVCILRRAMA